MVKVYFSSECILSIYGKLKYLNMYVLKLGLQRGGIISRNQISNIFRKFSKQIPENFQIFTFSALLKP